VLLDRVEGISIVLEAGLPQGLRGGRISEIGPHAIDHLHDDRGRVPEVGIGSCRDACQGAHIQDLATGHRIRVEQLGRPRVVAGAVDDHVARLREEPRVMRRRVVVVGIGRRAGNDAGDVNAIAADLGGDAAPEVLRGHHLSLAGA